MQMVKLSLLIPNDMRVVLSTAERGGLECPPWKERVQPTFLPVTLTQLLQQTRQLSRASPFPENVKTGWGTVMAVLSLLILLKENAAGRGRMALKWFAQNEQGKWQSGNNGVWITAGIRAVCFCKHCFPYYNEYYNTTQRCQAYWVRWYVDRRTCVCM